MLLGTYLQNDINHLNKTEILKKVRDSTNFSVSFVSLLVGSSIVCTLGLLLNSTAVVIGGMIISPLMWPLMQTSLGMSYGRSLYIRRALLVLIVATLMSLVTSILITYLSPIKLLNAEILSRTNPTLLDVIIALVAGGIAALAITHPKISETLAGVAIATSLIPPLCVSGIGLALSNYSVFWGALLLYFTNVISIIFVSVLVFLWLGLKTKSSDQFPKRAVEVTALILLVTAVPLFILLREYSFRSVAHSKTEQVMVEAFQEISPSIFVSNVRTSVSGENDNLVHVEAEVLVPDGELISYQERQFIQEKLEGTLNRRVDLKLRLQNTLSIVSKSDLEYSQRQNQIAETFISELSAMKAGLTIDSLDVYKNDADEKWIVTGILIGDPSISFAFREQQDLENRIEQKTEADILMDVDIVSRRKLQSQPDGEVLLITQEVESALFTELENTDITSISVVQSDSPNTYVTVYIELKAPSDFVFPQQLLVELKETFEERYDTLFNFEVDLIRVDSIKL